MAQVTFHLGRGNIVNETFDLQKSERLKILINNFTNDLAKLLNDNPKIIKESSK